jgi:CTP:molybdopterin cytidylyltransferase MocA
VLLCSRCDRGQIYCGADCARQARYDAQREAARRYQASRRGRFAHAARQSRYRARRQKVTHQGCAATAGAALLAADEDADAPAVSAAQIARPQWHCQRCGALCAPWVRSGFLRHHAVHRARYPDRRGPAP